MKLWILAPDGRQIQIRTRPDEKLSEHAEDLVLAMNYLISKGIAVSPSIKVYERDIRTLFESEPERFHAYLSRVSCGDRCLYHELRDDLFYVGELYRRAGWCVTSDGGCWNNQGLLLDQKSRTDYARAAHKFNYGLIQDKTRLFMGKRWVA